MGSVLFTLLPIMGFAAITLLVHLKILPKVAIFGAIGFICLPTLIDTVNNIVNLGAAIGVVSICINLLYCAGIAVIIYAAFDRSVPDIFILGASAVLCLPKFFNLFASLVSDSFSLQIFLNPAFVGIFALFVIISMTDFVPGIAALIKPFWFAPAVAYMIIYSSIYIGMPGINMPWIYMLSGAVEYLVLAYIASHREEA